MWLAVGRGSLPEVAEANKVRSSLACLVGGRASGEGGRGESGDHSKERDRYMCNRGG